MLEEGDAGSSDGRLFAFDWASHTIAVLLEGLTLPRGLHVTDNLDIVYCEVKEIGRAAAEVAAAATSQQSVSTMSHDSLGRPVERTQGVRGVRGKRGASNEALAALTNSGAAILNSGAAILQGEAVDLHIKFT